MSAHEEKMLNLQHQMRQNQSELQSYLAGLDDWTSEIKEKESKLKTQGQDKVSDLPPVRNTIEKKKMKKKKKEKKQDPNKPKKISGFDFRAWDKFDVDKALEEIDGDDKKEDTSSSEYETDEEWEMERKKHLAELEKDKGNKFLKTGDLDRAVEAYTKGMEFDATNAILPANRALALIKQQKFAAAELDCTTSISLDPLYVKAYLRRATARAGAGKVGDAGADYRRVLDLEPNNKQAKGELERLEKEKLREKEGPVKSSYTEGQSGVVKPIYKSPEERSKVPMKRIVIEEIGVEVASRPQRSTTGQSEVTQKITAQEEKAFDTLFTSPSQPPQKGEALSPQGESKTRTEISKTTTKSNGIQELPESESKTKTNPSNTSLSCEKKSSRPQPKSNGVSPSPAQMDRSKDLNHSPPSHQAKPTVSNGGAGGDGLRFPVPQSSFQFQADFKLLKTKSEDFFRYFQTIPPSQYPKLFGQCMDADILNAILKSIALHKTKSQTDYFDILLNLTEVKRFSMTAMFLSGKDKKVIEEILAFITESGNHTDEQIKSLRQKYQL